MRIVLDTNIWVYAMRQEENNKHLLECVTIISNFLQTKSDDLAVDTGREILKEYADNLKDAQAFQVMLMQLRNENRIQYVDAGLPQKITKRLDSFHFHEAEDRIFLGTAYNSDKYLITDDSDYNVGDKPGNEEAYRYFTEDLGMQILGPAEGADDTRKRMVRSVD